MTGTIDGKTVLISGATSESGLAVAVALVASGARVIGVGTRADALEGLERAVPGATTRVCDLSDAAAVANLHTTLRESDVLIDGLIHLVGGWRGGGGLTGQSDADWDVLDKAFATLRITSREFYPDLLQSEAGRLAIVSSTSVAHPTAGGANYAAAKAAAEAWALAVAQGFTKAGSSAASTIFVVRTLSGLEKVLAEHVVDLWAADAAELNGARIPLA